MEEEDDREEWLEAAAASMAVVAHELICLGSPWKRVSWRSLLRPTPRPGQPAQSEVDVLEEEIGTPAVELAAPSGWTVRRQRSRKPPVGICGSGKGGHEEGTAARERERASPCTPLDFSAGSGASASGGEEGSSAAASAAPGRPRPSELRGGTKVASRERAPLVFRAPEARATPRPGKKKTIPELQAVEKSLLEERRLLQKEVESRRRAHTALADENQKLKRLKLSLKLKSVPPTTAAASEETQFKDVHQMQDPNVFVPLPDLNEPWLEEFN